MWEIVALHRVFLRSVLGRGQPFTHSDEPHDVVRQPRSLGEELASKAPVLLRLLTSKLKHLHLLINLGKC